MIWDHWTWRNMARSHHNNTCVVWFCIRLVIIWYKYHNIQGSFFSMLGSINLIYTWTKCIVILWLCMQIICIFSTESNAWTIRLRMYINNMNNIIVVGSYLYYTLGYLLLMRGFLHEPFLRHLKVKVNKIIYMRHRVWLKFNVFLHNTKNFLGVCWMRTAMKNWP